MTATSLASPPRHTHHASPLHEPPAAIRATGIIVALTAVLAILAIALALPAARSPPTVDDPRGAGRAASALPIPLAGLLPAVTLVLLLKREVWTRLAAAVVFAAVAGTTIAALLRCVFGSIDQNVWGVAAGLTLGLLAAGLSILGLGSLFGRGGLILGALLALLLGHPLSGLNSAAEMLPTGWGTLGQWVPQGANATLLRSTAFFGGAGPPAPVAVLNCWAVCGAALVLIAAVRHGKS